MIELFAIRWLLPATLIICAIGGGAYYWSRGYRTSQALDINALAFVKPEMRKIDATISATGSIRLRVGTEVRVGSQLSGIVSKLNVTVGSHINKGDAIAEIDSRALVARIDQARAQVGLDEVALRKARRDLERMKSLFASGVLARKDLEDQQADLESAEARVEKSKQDLSRSPGRSVIRKNHRTNIRHNRININSGGRDRHGIFCHTDLCYDH